MRILLAGTHRCGSTWVANVLRTSPGLQVVYEPDCHRTGVLGKVSAARLGEYPALRPHDRSFWYSTVWDLAFNGGWPWSSPNSVRRIGQTVVRDMPRTARDVGVAALARASALVNRSPTHLLVKSADCALSLDWIAQRYQPRVLLQRRNPLNVVSSWMALDIDADPTLSERSAVREQWLKPLGIPVLPPAASQIARTAWNIGVLMASLKVSSERHPEWLVISHDALCADPKEGFRALFLDLGLTWSTRTEEYLDESDTPGFVDAARNPRVADERDSSGRRTAQASQYRRRLSKAQIIEAAAVLRDLPLGDWGVPQSDG